MVSYTEQQKQAIFTPDTNLVVVAGAGSGKTHVLVERYVNLLDDHPDWPLNALVAITFTREAALEMRNRVRNRLEARLREADTPESRERWSRLLSQMDTARIDTIHGLCATILRANAAEAGVDPQFDVLEPVEASALLTGAIDRVLHDLSESDTDTAALFTEYDMRQVREVLSQADVLTASLDDVPDDAEALFQAWRQEWAQTYQAEIARLLADADVQQALSMAASNQIPEGDKLTPNFELIAAHQAALVSDDVQASLQAAQTLGDAINLRGGSSKKWGSKEAVNEAKDALRALREGLKECFKRIGEPPGDPDRRGAEMTVRWYRLFGRVRNAYNTAKADNAALDFNDLERITADLLTTYESVRDRYRGSEFRRLLVDEFQDTNDAQWQIVRALADFENGALFVVGDMKQSIYGFRGADVRVFGNVRETIQTLDRGDELPLARSFRSHPALINVFNALFSELMTRDEASPVSDFQIAFDAQMDTMDAHRDVLPDTALTHFAPVEFLLLQTKTPELPESIKADERRLWEAYVIAERLKHLHADEAPIFDKETGTYREFDFSDAAILFRSTTSLPTYESVFKVAGLPFVTVGGRGYYNRQEVWDVLNLLKALHNPADNLALAAALRSPMFGFDDDMLLLLRGVKDDTGKRLSLWDALAFENVPGLSDAEQRRVQSACEILRGLRELAGRVTISELLRRSLAETGYLAALTGLPDGARLRRNVEKLIDIADDSGKITLGAFSHYLEDLTAREVREGEAALDAGGAVRLMTVHASKGLEFPVVVLADASRSSWSGGSDAVLYDDRNNRLVCKVYDDDEGKLTGTFPYQKTKQLQSDRDDAEELRLLYVAATRARDCLMFSGEIKRNKSGWTSYGWLDALLTAIDENVYGIFDEADDGFMLPYAGTSLRVHLPEYSEELIQQVQSSEAGSRWRDLDVVHEVKTPARLQPLDVQPDEMLGHITATQLGLIGGMRHASDPDSRESYRQYLRRQAFDDAPGRIRDVESGWVQNVRQRHIGNVVHEMLRYWRFPSAGNDYTELLESYAWQQGITDPVYVRRVVQEARRLLERFQASDLYHEIDAIKQADGTFYAEMPFLFRTDKRILHGMMDALYQRPEGQWVVLDYKTSYVPKQTGFQQHARRYYLQVGAYAAAVQQQLNVTPIVYVHYISYNETVNVPADAWQAEIRQIEDTIGTITGDF